jgi:hypothetical protein
MNRVDHTFEILNKIIPYLRNFSDIRTIVNQTGLECDDIEDGIDYILNHGMILDNARDKWLDRYGIIVGATREEIIIDPNSFQLNVADKLNVGYLPLLKNNGGTVPITLGDAQYLVKIKAQIGKNNTSTLREQIITIVKLITNATQVLISKPQNHYIDIDLIGNAIIYKINTFDNIESILDGTAKLRYIRILENNPFMFNTIDNLNTKYLLTRSA